MKRALTIDSGRLSLQEVSGFVFEREQISSLEIADACVERVASSHRRLYELIEKRLPIYGVTTGFGDSCFRFIDPSQGEVLQANLVSYLLCGTGATLPVEASRAMFLIRLKSLSRGYSGVSPELIERMRLYLQNDWIPVVPREGSLGASGDLIPLAYLAQALQGEGELHIGAKVCATRDVLAAAGIEPYRLKAKEGLALVNGTSSMAGLFLVNLRAAQRLLQLSETSTAWLALALGGRTEPFGPLVNERAGQHRGQADVARAILGLLSDESYASPPLSQMEIRDSQTVSPVQDRYSLRCAPQILGPVLETLQQSEAWLEDEVNGTSDNPLLDDDGSLGMGGNFYGGYLSQGMDYIKISLAHMADMMDRQLATLIDEKSNRGLPANLANWPGLPEGEHFLHHGLKGLHQSVSALTSEILVKAMPNGIFSRSSESHNQDKVSLGMSAAVQCGQMLDQLFTTQAMYLICLAQALDLRGIRLQGRRSVELYTQVRAACAFVAGDQPLDKAILNLSQRLRSPQ
jgi:histidine ammonia-lyase